MSTQPDEYAYDVFLSHSSKDKPRVGEVAERLRALGLRVWFDEWAIEHGDSIFMKIEEGLEQSRMLLLFMSQHAFGSDWATLEHQTFRFRDPLNRTRRFASVRLDDTEPRGSLATFKYFDWRSAVPESDFDVIVQRCRPGATPNDAAQEAPSGVADPVFHNRVLFPPSVFLGRDGLLAEMGKALRIGQAVALTQPAVLRGAGGVGKTRAAVEFVRRHGTAYTPRLMLSCDSAEALQSSLAEAAEQLDLPGHVTMGSPERAQLMVQSLSRGRTGLVVLDNVDSPEAAAAAQKLMHRAPGVRWIITARYAEWGQTARRFPVETLTRPDAIALLQKLAMLDRHAPGLDPAAEPVALALGDLPLALQQAAAYVAAERITWVDYLALLRAQPASVLTDGIAELKDVPESVLRTYRISIERLGIEAKGILHTAAYLAPEPIPFELFEATPGTPARTACVELARYSLAALSATDLTLHRCIGLAIRAELTETNQGLQSYQSALNQTTALSPDDPMQPANWHMWARLRPHIEVLLSSHARNDVPLNAWEWLGGAFPNYIQSRGEYALAERGYRAVWEVQMRDLGEEHPDTLSSRNNLATTLRAQGKHAEAEREHRAVWEVRKRVLGEEHLNTLKSRNNLANALDDQGKHAEAEQNHRAVWEVRMQVLGEEHPDTLSSRSNLTEALRAQGSYAEAECEHRAVWEVRKRVLGEEHPDTLSSRSNFAEALDDQGKYDEAEREHRAVWEVRKRVLGEEHPDTLKSRSNLVNALNEQGKHAEARVHAVAARDGFLRVLGADHPYTAIAQRLVAAIERALGATGEIGAR